MRREQTPRTECECCAHPDPALLRRRLLIHRLLLRVVAEHPAQQPCGAHKNQSTGTPHTGSTHLCRPAPVAAPPAIAVEAEAGCKASTGLGAAAGSRGYTRPAAAAGKGSRCRQGGTRRGTGCLAGAGSRTRGCPAGHPGAGCTPLRARAVRQAGGPTSSRAAARACSHRTCEAINSPASMRWDGYQCHAPSIVAAEMVVGVRIAIDKTVLVGTNFASNWVIQPGGSWRASGLVRWPPYGGGCDMAV